MMKFELKKRAVIMIGVVFSGFCWFFANQLSGDFGYLMWIAPVIILFFSLNTSPKNAFIIAFLAYLIGRMSWFNYLREVATPVPAVIFTIVLPLIFASIVLLTREIVIKINGWYGIFVFPIFYTAFEWVMIRFSPDGTATSIAYSQSNYLPLVQIVAVTGILGITFMLTFIPSSIAMAMYFQKEKKKLIPIALVTSLLTITVFIFGFIRIHNIPQGEKITVGLAVLDEKVHKMGNLDFKKELEHTRNYAIEADKLAKKGAKLIVLPERSINVNAETDSATIAILGDIAKKNHVTIIAGYTNYRGNEAHNSAFAIDNNGKVVLDYNKVHLVSILENEFVPGKRPGLFIFQNSNQGTAICKDLDFPRYIRQYGKNKITVLCIPAWDFVVDNWLHSRMAILAGVENGFSEVRTARLGQLTISDPYGRVNAEADCSDGKENSLVGQLFLNRKNTLYSQIGDWFGWLIIISALTFLGQLLYHTRKNEV